VLVWALEWVWVSGYSPELELESGVGRIHHVGTEWELGSVLESALGSGAEVVRTRSRPKAERSIHDR
jgi:hypothetical protein